MSLLLAGLVVAGFALVSARTGLLEAGREAGSRARASLHVLSDSRLDDATKEARLQEEARRLFAAFFRIVGGLALALGAPIVLVALLDASGVGSFSQTLAILTSWQFLVATTASAGIVGAALARARR